VLGTAVSHAETAGDQAAAALAAVALIAVKSSTQSTALERVLNDLQRLAAVLDQASDLDGARLARANAAFTLFAMGRASEALGIAKKLVEDGPSEEEWYVRARQSQGAAVVFGPTPIAEAVSVMASQRDAARGLFFSIGPLLGIGRLRAWEARFAEAREMLAQARRGFEELGNRHHVASAYGAEAEAAYLAAADPAETAKLAVRGYEALIATGDQSFASTQAVLVARTLLDVDDLGEAERFAHIALETSAADDVVSQAGGRSLQALVLARRGERRRATSLAREAEALMGATDYLVQHGEAAQDLATVLYAAGEVGEALEVARRARSLYQAKGAIAYVERLDRSIADWTA
jgi:tetratricopeptide (TPR) repeat protein